MGDCWRGGGGVGSKDSFSEETVGFWDSCQGEGWEVCGDILFLTCKQTPLESNM